MAIIERQRRLTEAGRIRLGQRVKSPNGKERPARLETLRFTSPSKRLIEIIAKLYGGQVQPWTPPRGAAEWEVITEADSVPVVVPPQDVDSSQFYELWSAAGVQRRCTGVRELLSDRPCVCDPNNRECSLHTRVNLMLRDVPGIGVWRLDTGGFYASMELPGTVEFLLRAQGMVPALLELRQRTVTRDGQTRHFVVPELNVDDFTPGQLISGQVVGLAVEAASQRSATAALPSTPAEDDPLAPYLAQIAATVTVEDLRLLWRRIGETAELTKEQTAELTQAFWARQKLINGRAAAQAAADAGGGPAEVLTAARDAHAEQDVNALWTSVLGAVAGLGWTTSDTSRHYRERMGHDPADANAQQMDQFLALVKGWELS